MTLIESCMKPKISSAKTLDCLKTENAARRANTVAEQLNEKDLDREDDAGTLRRFSGLSRALCMGRQFQQGGSNH